MHRAGWIAIHCTYQGNTFPAWQFGFELDHILLQHTQRRGANSVLCLDAGAVVEVHGDAFVRIGDALDYAVEEKPGVVRSEKPGRSATEPSVEAALVNHEVVLIAPLVEGEVVPGDAELKAGLLGWVRRLSQTISVLA